MNGHNVVFGQLVQKLEQTTLCKTIKMNGHSVVVFGQLVQKLEQITPNSSTL